jgi:hypothetical protein
VGNVEHDVLGGQQHGIALCGHLRALAEDGAAVGPFAAAGQACLGSV